MRVWVVLFATLVLTLLVLRATRARADGASNQELAWRMSKMSEERYRAGAYQEAAALLRNAYRLHPEPILLYNLGRSLEKAGDRAGAASAYRSFLASAPSVEDRAAIEAHVTELEKPSLEVARPPAPPAPIVTPPPVRESHKVPVYRRWWLWTSIGVAAAAVAVGLGVGLTSTQATPSASTGLGTYQPPFSRQPTDGTIHF